MAIKAGVWIDAKKALVVKLSQNSKTLKKIESGIESREREMGQGKQFGRFGGQFLVFEKRKERKILNAQKLFFKSILKEIENCDELVLFGPSTTKVNLHHQLESNNVLKIDLKEDVNADSMTDNQVVAWVVDYYS